jgi:hypothetical protein
MHDTELMGMIERVGYPILRLADREVERIHLYQD